MELVDCRQSALAVPDVEIQSVSDRSAQKTAHVVLAMILRFLRLFPQFRALESDRDSQVVVLRETLQRETTEKLMLQDRLDAVLSDRSRMWDTLQEALRGERTAYQMGINFAVQPKGFGLPYPDAPHIPANAVPQVQDSTPIGGRDLPSQVMNRVARQFAESLIQPRQ